MLDTSRFIETPEGVQIRVNPAGPVPRALAYAVDFALRALVVVGTSFAIRPFGDFGAGLMLLAMFALEWLYPVLFEVFAHGRTPGKRLLGIRTVRDDGVPVGWTASAVRNLLRGADALPVMYGFGLVSTVLARDFKRLGDLAAGTVVIHDPSPPAVGTPAAAADPLPPPWPLAPEEERAIAEFAERHAALGDARATEIALLLVRDDVDSAERVRRYAAWLGGHRPGAGA